MQAVFHIHPQQSEHSLEQSYLLMLALLNFEHKVFIIFHQNSLTEILKNTEQAKKWQALDLYGAQAFLHYGGDNDNIDAHGMHQLMQQADFIA